MAPELRVRPIDKGAPPEAMSSYQDAGPHLVNRLGRYCSYCERLIETHLAVEHVQPKALEPELATEWSNLLLACVNCNSTKGSQPVKLDDFFWPDCDNTLRAVRHRDGGLVEASPDLNARDRERAERTIALTGLDRYPGHTGREPSRRDERWQRRQQVWQFAKRKRAQLEGQDTVTVRELIVENAIPRGMFSIWWTVFEGDVDMRRRLREAFIGTASNCFNGNEDAIPRQGGKL